MKLYDARKDLRDKFEIVTIHDSSVKSFSELDEKLVDIRKRFWENRELPFAVLIDDDNKSVDAYGVKWFPTSLLIDPEGRVVAGDAAELLEARLKELASPGTKAAADGP